MSGGPARWSKLGDGAAIRLMRRGLAITPGAHNTTLCVADPTFRWRRPRLMSRRDVAVSRGTASAPRPLTNSRLVPVPLALAPRGPDFGPDPGPDHGRPTGPPSQPPLPTIQAGDYAMDASSCCRIVSSERVLAGDRLPSSPRRAPGDTVPIDRPRYLGLANFRYAVRRFLAASERISAESGITTQQYQAM